VQPVTRHPAGERPAPDDVDETVEFWRRENPDLDVVTKEAAMRLRRAGHALEKSLRHELAALGVEAWELEMLLALRRASGCCSSAGGLMRDSGVTSGAITNRLDRLEERGLVRREPDPSDRRQIRVVLTDGGRARADRFLAAKSQAEQAFFAGVDRDLLARLAGDLRTLLAAHQSACPDG
jgi:DNA-binding MarR family transcriptional regulator